MISCKKLIIRIISHAEFGSLTCDLFKAHQITNIYQLNKYMTYVLMCKHTSGMLLNLFNYMFKKHMPSYNNNMRQHITYKIPQCKSNS